VRTPKPEPDIRSALRQIKRRADEAGVDVREYLDELIRVLEERRRESVIRRRAARRLKPS
jgi:hypothetical protein